MLFVFIRRMAFANAAFSFLLPSINVWRRFFVRRVIKMLKKNLALSAVHALTLVGMTAYGGGSGSSTEKTVATFTPPTIQTLTAVLPEFSSATYLRENNGFLTIGNVMS